MTGAISAYLIIAGVRTLYIVRAANHLEQFEKIIAPYIAEDERVKIARPVDEVYRLLAHEETEWLLPFLRLAAHKGEKAGAELRARLQSRTEAPVDGPRTMDGACGVGAGEPA